MATITKKTRNGKTYYYATQCGRVNGKPRVVWQKYLGTLDTIIKMKDDSTRPEVEETDVFEAGGIAAMLQIADKIKLVDIIDSVVLKRSQGPSVGQYLLLAAINRVLDPCSKLKMPEWYKDTILYRLWKYSSGTFSSQHFWNNMDLIQEDHLEKIQEKIAKRVIEEYNINPSAILYDTTNFFTYIATGNQRNTIAQRGRSKAKRNDLRQVGLALLVTKEFNIPLFHNVYQGNIADAGDFPQKAKEIIRWQKNTLKTCKETTMVFDKGNISEKGMEQLIGLGQHFICAIPKITLSELFKTSIKELKPVEGIAGTRAYITEVELWSKTFKVVLSYSESFFSSQLFELTTRLQKCEKKLRELDCRLATWAEKKDHKNRPTRKSVQKAVSDIVSGAYTSRIVKVKIMIIKGIQRIHHEVDREELHKIETEELGRTLIISTRRQWSGSDIIKHYRGLNSIENAFRNMKNQEFLHWQPAYHWTDQKIKVHGLYCVLALLMASLAHKTVQEAGIDISLPRMLQELCNIREVALIYSDKSRKKSKLTISKMSHKQKKIATALEISKVLVW